MKGKAAIVTGGASGLGYNVVNRLSEAGVKVVIASRNEKKGKKAEEEFRKAGEKTVRKEKSAANKSSTKGKSNKKTTEKAVSQPAGSQRDKKEAESSEPQQLSLFDCYES